MIREHLAGALRMMQARDVSCLSPRVRRRRERLARALVAYRERGSFPKNHEHPLRRMPAFVDAHETRCALAHLVETTGERALVEHVARTRNHAFVGELAVTEPALVAWLEDNGITEAEAARIQPSYSYEYTSCICGHRDVEVEAVAEGALNDGAVEVERVRGQSVRVIVGTKISPASLQGRRALAVYWKNSPKKDAGSTPDMWLSDRSDGRIHCGDSMANAPDLSIALDRATDAIMSKDCRGALVAIDKRWGEAHSGGVSMGGADEPTLHEEEPIWKKAMVPVGLLAATGILFGVIVLRRRKKS